MVCKNKCKLHTFASHMYYIPVCCLLLVFTVPNLNGQEMRYQIDWKGDSIGYMEASRLVEDSLEHISMYSKSKVSIIFSFRIGSEFDATYVEGE